MKSRTHRKIQHKNLEYGSYKLRVGGLWGNSSEVIVITDIYQHVWKNGESVEVRFSRLDDLSQEYISERFVTYIEKSNYIPIG